MRTTLEFLDAVRAKHGLTSDYQLAKFLGVRQSTISNYRNRNGGLDERMALKVAAALDLDAAHVLACVAAERTPDAEVKKAWQRAAAATAAVILSALAWTFCPEQGGDVTLISFVILAAPMQSVYTLCAFILLVALGLLAVRNARTQTVRTA